jgi:hypothetical protein
VNTFVADAHRDVQRFIVSANEKLTSLSRTRSQSFVSIEAGIAAARPESAFFSYFYRRAEGRSRPHDRCATESGGH